MSTVLLLTVVAVGVILVFDYTNGFNDASNIIATVIASRAMTPVQAVLVVAAFEFLGPLLGGTVVANTIGTIVDVADLGRTESVVVILCGVVGAITWNLGTWWAGIPSSSSHALVGGLVGAVVLAAGPQYVHWGWTELVVDHHVTGVTKVLIGLVISPLVGFWAGFAVHRLMSRLLHRARPTANRTLRRAQWATSAWLAFSHGANDAQKSMGIITLVLLLGGHLESFAVPFWVILACASAITLGILSGGWRIVRTVGFGIYKVRPLHAFDAQVTAASVIFAASVFGAPVSTTHVVSSSIMGIGASERPKAVRWSKAKEIVSTWVVTIPGAGAVAAGAFLVSQVVS